MLANYLARGWFFWWRADAHEDDPRHAVQKRALALPERQDSLGATVVSMLLRIDCVLTLNSHAIPWKAAVTARPARAARGNAAGGTRCSRRRAPRAPINFDSEMLRLSHILLHAKTLDTTFPEIIHTRSIRRTSPKS